VADPRYGVTSLADLGRTLTTADLDVALRHAFEEVFGAVKQRLPEAISSRS
jgi:lipoyl(octanoyl) transferase